MSDMFAEVNGIKICYEIHGDGDPIVLVHGFGAKKEIWRGQIGDLSKNFKVIILDNRGAGKSDRPSGKYTMELFADDVCGLLDYLKIEKVKAVIGWSLGGMIVQQFALKYPSRAEKIGLIFTNHKGAGGELYKKMRHDELDLLINDPEKCFWQAAKSGYYYKFRKQMEADPKKKFHGIWSVEDLIKEDSINPPSHEDIDNQANALDTHDVLERLHEIKNPVILIAASHDRLTPKPVMMEMDEKIPNSTFKVIDRAGHGSPLSRAPEVNQILIEFLMA